jgi:endonuclease/exonuclease/phosphatase (EEP) superfamily protein YafD
VVTSVLASRSDLQIGVALGLTGIAIAVALWMIWRQRGMRRPAIGGALIAGLSVLGLEVRVGVPRALVAGLLLLMAAGWLGERRRLSLIARAALAAPGAVVMASITWDEQQAAAVALALVIVVGGTGAIDLDRRWRSPAIAPGMIAIASFGVWLATSGDPRPATIVFGVAAAIAVAAWPGEMTRLGTGAYAAMGVLAFGIEQASVSTATTVASVAAVGLLVAEPTARLLVRFKGPLLSNPGSGAAGGLWLAQVLIAILAALLAMTDSLPVVALGVPCVLGGATAWCVVLARRVRAAHDRRRLAAGWPIAIAMLVVHTGAILGLSEPLLIDLAWALLPVLLVPCWFVLIPAVLSGRRALGAVSGLAALGHVLWLAPGMLGASASVDDGISLRVVSANINYWNVDFGPIIDEIGSYGADVIVLQEARTQVQGRLLDAFEDQYPYHVFQEEESGNAAATFSKHPLEDPRIRSLQTKPLITVGVEVSGVIVQVWNVHAASPTSDERREIRDSQLDELREMALEEDGPLVLAGDFNTTMWHQPLRKLVDAGFSDAHWSVGRALAGTWGPRDVGVAGLDHVLISDELGVIGIREGIGEGSDHRPLIVDLVIGA